MRTLVLTMVNGDGEDVLLGVFRSETAVNAWLMDEFAERGEDGRDVRPVWRGEYSVRFDTAGEDWLRFWCSATRPTRRTWDDGSVA
jgi:hypothetical protein